MEEILGYDEPCFVISVAARMLGVRTQTLRYYEHQGLIEPHRTKGNQRVFSRRDVERVRYIRSLVDELGVNLAGIEVLLKLMTRLQEAEAEMRRLGTENEQLHNLLGASERA